MDKLYYGMSDMMEAIHKNLDKMVNERYGLIVGLTRGGLIPAVYISHLLNVPMRALQFSSKAGNGSGENDNKIPLWFYGDEKILIVDDIADTGNTLRDLVPNDPNYHTFVLTYKKQSCYTPTYIGMEVSANCWTVFPWEVS